LIRGFLAFFLLTTCSAPAAQQTAVEEGELDASQKLFAVMAAINAAGYDAELKSPSNSPLRAVVRREVAAKNPACLEELRTFFAVHHRDDATAELSQYVSFALSVGDPPGFEFRYKTNELPPDVAALDGFQALLQKFYVQAGIERIWRQSQPAFEEAIARYHGPAREALLAVNAYVRASTSPNLHARFQVYVDLLAAPNQIQTRSYKNDSFVVLTPSAELQFQDLRHAYLHFQVDPLAVRYSEELNKKKALLDFAQAAPALEDFYKADFLLLATECLIKAIESRLAPAGQRQAAVDQAFREGFILTPVFAEALPAYEKQEQSLRFYYPELVKAIDLNREDQRLAAVVFVSERPARRAKEALVERPAELTGARKTLEEAEQHYRDRDFDQAKAAYLKALKETGEQPLHAKAYYGLARIAANQRDPQLAEDLFEKTLTSSPDAEVQAWSHVYLGRLADAAGEREQATRHYQAALDVRGGSDAARTAAQQGLREAFNRKTQQQP
jgi:tetratricopeptide (TPR) repeat protein